MINTELYGGCHSLEVRISYVSSMNRHDVSCTSPERLWNLIPSTCKNINVNFDYEECRRDCAVMLLLKRALNINGVDLKVSSTFQLSN